MNEVFFGVMTPNLFDGWVEDAEHIDQHASARKYAELCAAAIELQMDAEVDYEIRDDIGGVLPLPLRTTFNGYRVGDYGEGIEAQAVDELRERVFVDCEWLVEKT